MEVSAIFAVALVVFVGAAVRVAVEDLPSMTTPILRVRDLRTSFTVDGRSAWAVRGVDLDLDAGERVGLVGESGSGKSVTALSLLRLVPEPPGRITHGRVELDGRDLLALPPAELRKVRGRDVAMVFQEPMSSLNPVLTIGEQVAEGARIHLGLDRRQARRRAADLLDALALPDASRRLDEYPHQMSGGMLQRALIAMALMCDPRVLLADEPTTALDVTIQAQIIALIREQQRARGLAVLWITHDLAVVGETCDRVLVMYGGRIQEEGPVETVFARPLHPYTRGLLASVPERAERGRGLAAIPGNVPSLFALSAGCRFAARCTLAEDRCRAEEPDLVEVDGRRVRCFRPGVEAAQAAPEALAPIEVQSASLVDVRDLTVSFPRHGGWFGQKTGDVRAVDGVSFELRRGEALGLVGESGSGKTTVGRAIANLLTFAAPGVVLGGSIRYDGHELNGASRWVMQPFRSKIGLVFQDPYGSLNPRLTVQENVEGALRVAGIDGPARRARVVALLERVGLGASDVDRFPHEFSGGQRQRIGIARALASGPELVIADEPVSALDVSVQAQVINLLSALRRELGLTLLFIAHDLALVRYVADRVAVMYAGRLVEVGPADAIWRTPRHPYTRALLSAVPRVDPAARRDRIVIPGEPPSALFRPTGCAFHTRCPIARPTCATSSPPWVDVGEVRVACPFVAE